MDIFSVFTLCGGLAFFLYGMTVMSKSLEKMAGGKLERMLKRMTSSPFKSLLLGAGITIAIQSSSAMTVMLVGLVNSGVMELGQTIGVNRNAKRVAVVHISFNVIGTTVCLILFYGGDLLFHFAFMDWTVGAVGIAFCHTAFNVFTTILLLPFSRQLEKLARRLVRTEDTRESFAFLDPLLLRTPGAAVSESVAMAGRMGQAARENICLATDQLSQYSRERETQILQNEDKLDIYEDRLSSYLVEISQHGLSMQDMRTVSRLLHAIGDFERIGDHAVNIQESAQELHDKELRFSDSAREELQVLLSALDDILDLTIRSFQAADVETARRVEPLEETIDQLIEEIRSRHIQRLQAGQCTIQLGFVLSDLLTNIERASDHCSNIAVSVIEECSGGPGRHAYLQEVKAGGAFGEDLRRDQKKYHLPEA